MVIGKPLMAERAFCCIPQLVQGFSFLCDLLALGPECIPLCPLVRNPLDDFGLALLFGREGISRHGGFIFAALGVGRCLFCSAVCLTCP